MTFHTTAETGKNMKKLNLIIMINNNMLIINVCICAHTSLYIMFLIIMTYKIIESAEVKMVFCTLLSSILPSGSQIKLTKN